MSWKKKSKIHVVKTRAKFISRLLDMWNTAFPYSDLKGFRHEGLSFSLEEKKNNMQSLFMKINSLSLLYLESIIGFSKALSTK